MTKSKTLIFILVAVACALPASAQTVFRIDLDNNDGTGPFTETGWTSIPLLNTSTSGSVTIEGIEFVVSDFSGSRNRIAANTTPLTRDFIFNDSTTAITMSFGDSGSLLAGTWEVSVWSFDRDVPVAPSTIGFRENGAENEVGTNLPENATDPVLTFQFTSDGESNYELFIRDADPGSLPNNVRLNAVSLRLLERAEYRIDLDSANGGGPFTEGGWTSLFLGQNASSGSVKIDGITFTSSEHTGTRSRGVVNTTSLTRDFAFNDNGAAIRLGLGGAGDLATGAWQVSVWSWDSNVPVAPATVGYRTNGGSDTIVGTSFAANQSEPVATFQFTSDGISSYDLFIRDDTPGGAGSDRVRLNAVSLKRVPADDASAPALVDFSYDRDSGSAQVTIKGDSGGRYKLVEADDLSFSSPDQDPVPLTGVTIGTQDGNEVVTDTNGNATVQFSLGTAKSSTYLRAESAP